MSDHILECRWESQRCICEELRACEQRVLDAAEAAVNEVLDRTPNAMNNEYISVSKHFPADLIAAIRALKEKP